jgi:hypothetical protein
MYKSFNETFIRRGLFLLFCLFLTALFFMHKDAVFVNRFWPDEALYAWYAKKIAENFWFIFSHEANTHCPPLFAFILSLSMHFTPSPEVSFRTVGFIFNVLGIIGIFFLGRRVCNDFVGVLAAVLLAMNPLYLIQSSFILIDGPLAFFYVLFVLVLLKINDRSPMIWHIVLGVVVMLSVMLKWSALLMIPILLIFYLLVLGRRAFLVFIPLLICLPIALLWFMLGPPAMSALTGVYSKGTPLSYILDGSDILFFGQIGIVFIFFMGFFSLKERAKNVRVILLSWFLVVFLAVSLAVEKDFRYLLPVLPFIMLLIAMGMDWILTRLIPEHRRHLTYIYVLLIILAIVPVSNKNSVIQQRAFLAPSYAGFAQAGQWIKQHVPEDAVVLTGSFRQIRYYSDKEFIEYGGKIIPNQLDMPSLRSLMARSKDLFLEIDVWDFIQPDWVYPINDEKLQELRALGFIEQMAVMEYFSDGKEYPVIRIFRYSPTLRQRNS